MDSVIREVTNVAETLSPFTQLNVTKERNGTVRTPTLAWM
jgi:hypothetical protein